MKTKILITESQYEILLQSINFQDNLSTDDLSDDEKTELKNKRPVLYNNK